jgi:chorismate synthase
MNSFGSQFRITTYGESHGESLGVIIDGCPAGLEIDLEDIQHQMDRRRPGQSKITTQRKESDEIQILSGVFEGKTTGMPILLAVFNHDAKSKDYSHIAKMYRPSHADFTWDKKYGYRDYRGGGRSSARETLGRVAAGAIAQQFLRSKGITVDAWVDEVGPYRVSNDHKKLKLSVKEENIVRCPEPETAEKMIELIDQVRKNRDTIGGIVKCSIQGCPIGLGEPVFDRLHAELGKGMLSINACKGFEIGSGFDGTKMRGSEHNDQFYTDDSGQVRTKTNYSGGVQGGISNGEEIYFRVAFKPVATIMIDQESVDQDGNSVSVKGKGRHDPCVVPRAVPIVEAMAAITVMDFWLRAGFDRSAGKV